MERGLGPFSFTIQVELSLRFSRVGCLPALGGKAFGLTLRTWHTLSCGLLGMLNLRRK